MLNINPWGKGLIFLWSVTLGRGRNVEEKSGENLGKTCNTGKPGWDPVLQEGPGTREHFSLGCGGELKPPLGNNSEKLF